MLATEDVRSVLQNTRLQPQSNNVRSRWFSAVTILCISLTVIRKQQKWHRQRLKYHTKKYGCIGISAAIGIQNTTNQWHPLRQLTVTSPLLKMTLQPNFFCTNNAPFATGNKRTANDVSQVVSELLCSQPRRANRPIYNWATPTKKTFCYIPGLSVSDL